jgi:uncharacterized protein YyaL (SSP411 family)
MIKHLQNEQSPYLQQHAKNPVDWYPWGEEAFEKAKRENKAIFLSIGYSACHWCHVMEKESFQDERTAKILNTHFVSIKVDREERPDIDKHFQEVYQLMNQRAGGWPTSFFLTQDKKPFYAATYIPDEPRYGMMSFSSLLEVIADKYAKEKNLLTEKADEILGFLNPKADKIQATKLDLSIVSRLTNQAKQLFDSQNGGFNKAPKFPQASLVNLLLDVYTIRHDKETLDMALFSLSSMAKGGLRDVVEGGFCRYSTDNTWLVPHFEKMTYDNALLSEVYLKAYHISKNSFYKEIAFQTLDFMLDKMSETSLFYCSSDADTEGIEGKYFVYSYERAMKIFSKTTIPSKAHKALAKSLNITKEGNFEGKNIIRIDKAKETIEYYDEAIVALKKHREKRLYPAIDNKILVSWNAMMIKSLFKASRSDEKYLNPAISSLDTLLKTMYINSELYHSTLIGQPPKIKAFLEDYAYLSELLIEAYQSTLNEIYLITATKLANQAIDKYFDKGKWKFSRGEFETHADIYDASYPSSISTMLSVLYSLSSLVDTVYKKFVFKTLEIYSYDVMRQPISSPKMSNMLIRYLNDDTIIKATEANLKAQLSELDSISRPFTYFKVDKNDGFMLCNTNSCFGHERDFSAVLGVLGKH